MQAVVAPSPADPVAIQPPCPRCGRVPAAGETEPRGEGLLCAACSRNDVSRCAGQPSFDYSPFRRLLSPA